MNKMFRKFYAKRKKNQKGFTLVELIIVIAILGVLSGIAAPSVFGYISQAQVRADQTTAKTIQNAIKMVIVGTDPSATAQVISNETGDLVVGSGTNMTVDVFKAKIEQKLGSGSIPLPKETGHKFYVLKSRTLDYLVVSATSQTEADTTLNIDYPGAPTLTTNNCIPLNP